MSRETLSGQWQHPVLTAAALADGLAHQPLAAVTLRCSAARAGELGAG
jgi:hypothetical protein